MILPVKGTHLVFMVGPFQEIFKIESSLSLGLVACYHSCYHIYCRLLPVITAPCAGQQAILQAANLYFCNPCPWRVQTFCLQAV
jgi:hypothetical protein